MLLRESEIGGLKKLRALPLGALFNQFSMFLRKGCGHVLMKGMRRC